MAHEKIALRCSAYLWGVATLVTGELRVNLRNEDDVKRGMSHNGALFVIFYFEV